MPRPINIPDKIANVVAAPGALWVTCDRLLTLSNPLLSEFVNLINQGQQVFNQIRDLIPPRNGATVEDWDRAAADRNWRDIPPGGVIAAIGATRTAAHAYATRYATVFIPAILSRPGLLIPDEQTGLINMRIERLPVQTDEVNLVRAQLEAYRTALEPISEQ